MRLPVTALLPIRNGEDWVTRIAQNLKSCLLPKDQLIIIDDHSTDDTVKLLSKLEFDFEFEVFHNPEKGLVSALNYGIHLAKNEWIARFDVDDEYPAERITLQLKSLNAKTVAIFGDYVFVDSRGKELGIMPSPVFSTATALSLIHSDRTAHPCVIFRKASAIEVGLYREEDFPSEDLSLWIRLASVGELETVPETVLRYTLHSKSISASRYREAKNRSDELIRTLVDFKTITSSCERDFVKCMQAYSNLTYGRERKVLFMRDLFSPQIFPKFSKKFRFKLIAYASLLFINPLTIIYSLKLFMSRKRRRKIRFH